MLPPYCMVKCDIVKNKSKKFYTCIDNIDVLPHKIKYYVKITDVAPPVSATARYQCFRFGFTIGCFYFAKCLYHKSGSFYYHLVSGILTCPNIFVPHSKIVRPAISGKPAQQQPHMPSVRTPIFTADDHSPHPRTMPQIAPGQPSSPLV